MKTNKSFTKRLRVTKNGKIMARSPGQNHFNAKQSGTKRLARKRTVSLKLEKRITRRFSAAVGQQFRGQFCNGLELREENLTTQPLQKLRSLQTVHHRPLDLTEVQADASRLQTVANGLQAFQCTGVNVIDG